MLKSKFMAGLVATFICLVFVVVAAVILTTYTEGRTGDRLIKIVAFATIGIWLALYAWLTPKNKSVDQPQKDADGNVKQVIKPRETVSNDRNARR